MKYFLISYILPLASSVLLLFYLYSFPFPLKIFDINRCNNELSDTVRVVESLTGYSNPEILFQKRSSTGKKILLIGSSEITYNTSAAPYNFIRENYGVQVTGLGSAGNQCFSIYCTLLANAGTLTELPLVIILSPGWFESKSALGTPSDVFLNFSNEQFLTKVSDSSAPSEFTGYARKRISGFYHEFNSPGLPLRLLYLEHVSSKSLIHKTLCYPVICFDKVLLSFRNSETGSPALLNLSNDTINEPERQNNVKINWDSLFAVSCKLAQEDATNNNLGIENSYYTEHIGGRRGKIQPVPLNKNTELQDFVMLVKLLKEYNNDAVFVIQPFNALYYKNICDMQPAVDFITGYLKENNLRCCNMFTSDTSGYNKAILRDVMHLSDYGWLTINKFITESFNLEK